MSTSQVPSFPPSPAGPASRATTSAAFAASPTAVIPSSTTVSARSPTSQLPASPSVMDSASNGLSQDLIYIIAGMSAVVGVSIAVALFCCWRAKKRKAASAHDPPLSSAQLQAERSGDSGATRDQVNSSQDERLLPSTAPERAPFMVAKSDTLSNGGGSGSMASSPTSSIPTLPDSVPSMSQSHSPESNDRLSVSADTLVKSAHSAVSLSALAAASKSQLKYSLSVDEMSNASVSISSRRTSLSRSANDVILQYQKSYERAMSIHADSVYGEPSAVPNRNSASMGRSKSTIALNALSERSKSIPFKAAFIERVCEVVASSDELAAQPPPGSLPPGFENDEKVVQFAQSFNRRYSSAYSAVEAMDEEAVRSRMSGAFILNQSYWHSEPVQSSNGDGENEDNDEISTSDFDSESDDAASRASLPNGKQEAGRKSASLSLTPLRSSLIQKHSSTSDQNSYHQVYSSVSYYWSSPEFSAKWEAASSHLSNTSAEYAEAWQLFLTEHPQALIYY
ncbi:hypothetical protein BJ741DRAFT_604307 [Chytriomyces cf. hyalinus JEL632]|nr:hypothetical protein BJ741DRAFT_604307 [Chytriomyces cf. hyalinus JEL632]